MMIESTSFNGQPSISPRMIFFAVLITFILFLSLPMIDFLIQPKPKYITRTIETVPIPKIQTKPLVQQKPGPSIISKPNLKRLPKTSILKPLALPVQLDLSPGHGDFGIDFSVYPDLGLTELVFELSEVDSIPVPTHQTPPIYPYSARINGIEGKVSLKAIVKEDGTVGPIQVLSSEPGKTFIKAAKSALIHWRFKPGMKDNQPVPTWVIVPFIFELESKR